MSKFCSNCGKQLDDNAVFCNNCGTKLGQPAQQQYSQPVDMSSYGFVNNGATAVKKGSKKTLVIVCAFVAVLIAAVVILLVLVRGKGYEKPFDKMVKGVEKCDAKSLISMYIPDEFSDAILNDEDLSEKLYGADYDEYCEKMGEQFQEELEDRYGKNVKVSYKIINKEKLEKDELEDAQDQLDKNLDGIKIDYKPKVKEGYKVKVKISYKGDDNKATDTQSVCVFKVNNDWIIEGQFITM